MESKVSTSHSIPTSKSETQYQPKSIGQITQELIDNSSTEINNSFEFLTGQKKADPSNLFDMWIKRKIIPATKGFDQNQKSQYQSLFNAETLVKQLGINNAINLLACCYQMALIRKKNSRDTDDQDFLDQATELFKDELENMLKKHPHEFDHPYFAKDKVNKKHVPSDFLQELQDNSKAKFSLSKLFAIGGLFISSGLLGAFGGFLFGRRMPAQMNNQLFANTTAPRLPDTCALGEVSHLEWFKTMDARPALNVVEMHHVNYTELLNWRSTAWRLQNQVDLLETASETFSSHSPIPTFDVVEVERDYLYNLESENLRLKAKEKELTLLKNSPSEEAQALYRKIIRDEISKRVEFGSDCSKADAIADLFQLLTHATLSPDYPETLALAKRLLTDDIRLLGNKQTLMRSTFMQNKDQLPIELLEFVAERWLDSPTSVEQAKEIFFYLFDKNLGYQTAEKAFLARINPDTDTSLRSEYFDFINEFDKKNPTQPVLLRTLQALAESAVRTWSMEFNREAYPSIDHIAYRLITWPETRHSAMEVIRKWFDSDNRELLYISYHAIDMWFKNPQVADDFYKDLSTIFINLYSKETVPNPHTRSIINNILFSWLNQDLTAQASEHAIVTTKQVISTVNTKCQDCDETDYSEIIKILKKMVQKGQYDLAISTAIHWSKINQNEFAAQIFADLIDNMPLKKLPKLSEQLIDSCKEVSDTVMDFLEKWSKKDFSKMSENPEEIQAATAARLKVYKQLLKQPLSKYGRTREGEKALDIIKHLFATDVDGAIEVFGEVLPHINAGHAQKTMEIFRANYPKEKPGFKENAKIIIETWKKLTSENTVRLVSQITSKLHDNQVTEDLACYWLKEHIVPSQIDEAAWLVSELFLQDEFVPTKLVQVLNNLTTREFDAVVVRLTTLVKEGKFNEPNTRKPIIQRFVQKWQSNEKGESEVYDLVMAAVNQGMDSTGIDYATHMLNQNGKYSKNMFKIMFSKQQGFKEFSAAVEGVSNRSAEHALQILFTWISNYQHLADYRETAAKFLDRWVHILPENRVRDLASTLVNNGFPEPVIARVIPDLKGKKKIAIDFFNMIKEDILTTNQHVQNKRKAKPEVEACITDRIKYESEVCTQDEEEFIKSQERAEAAQNNFQKLAGEIGQHLDNIPKDWMVDPSVRKFLFEMMDYEVETAKVEAINTQASKLIAKYAEEYSLSNESEQQQLALELYTELANKKVWISRYEGKDFIEPALVLADKVAITQLPYVTKLLIAAIENELLGIRHFSNALQEVLNNYFSDKKKLVELVYNPSYFQGIIDLVKTLAKKGSNELIALMFIEANALTTATDLLDRIYQLAIYLDDNGHRNIISGLRDSWTRSEYQVHQEMASKLVEYMISHKDNKDRDLAMITNMVVEWSKVASIQGRAQAIQSYNLLLAKDWDRTFPHARDSITDAFNDESLQVRGAAISLIQKMYESINQLSDAQVRQTRLDELNDHAMMHMRSIAKTLDKKSWSETFGFGDHKARVERALQLINGLVSSKNFADSKFKAEIKPITDTAVSYAKGYGLALPNTLKPREERNFAAVAM